MLIQYDRNGARALRSLKTATKGASETLKKLSSGYCVNVAADDAAGLAVSEKMRMQITGLDRAEQNSLEGSRLIQIGDGSLEEIHRMLNRAVELANMSSNGTYEDEVDREALQNELDKLYDEIDRITESANFNGIKLFQDKGYEYETGNAERRILAMRSMLEAHGEYPPPGFGYMAEPGYQPPKGFSQTRSTQSQVAVVSASSSESSKTQGLVIQSSTSAKNIAASMEADTMTLNDVIKGTKEGTVSIVYTDSPTKAIATSAANSLGVPTVPASQANDPVIDVGGGQTKRLSEVLKEDIIPNVVNNIINTYGKAFGYLKDSTNDSSFGDPNSPMKGIGIGLEYFNQSATPGGSSTLAYVTGGTDSSNTQISFTLGVNINGIKDNAKRDGTELSGLEATITHEMIHAFMDQGTTAGMLGMQGNQDGGVSPSVSKFPGWFVEGMAQTASGANDRLINEMHLLTSSTKDTTKPDGQGTNFSNPSTIFNDSKFQLHSGTGTTSSEYGTGYLACMYLGAVVGGYTVGSGSTSADLATAVKSGLNQILSSLIGGASLDSTINVLTQDFSSTTDFQNKFNSGTGLNALNRDQFIQDLCNAICEDGGGRGGLASSSNDGNPFNDSDLIQINGSPTNRINGLFELDPATQQVKNYQTNNVLSGGALSSNGLSPSGNLPSYGELSFKDSDIINMKYQQNGNDHKFTFLAGGGDSTIISMATAGAASLGTKHDIILQDNATVALDNAKLTGGGSTVTAEKNATVKLTGDNTIGDLKLDSDASIKFSEAGSVSLTKITADSSNTITVDKAFVNLGANDLKGANVVIQNGGAALGSPTAGVSGNVPALEFPNGVSNVDSVAIKGIGKASANSATALYLDPSQKSYVVTFTDSAGATKTLAAIQDANGKFQWADMKSPFTVTGGTEGIDYEYDFETDTLNILTNTPLTISGGISPDTDPLKLNGCIKLKDDIGAVSLTLDNADCDVSNTDKCAFDLGKNNQVTLTLKENPGEDNTFKSGKGWAGISLSEGTSLTIDATSDTDCILKATGGNSIHDNTTKGGGGAGIGRSSSDINKGKGGNIIINGGNITATGGGGSQDGGGGGAGIGAASMGFQSGEKGLSIGNIEIHGGDINARGGAQAAGIGGARQAAVADITIDGSAKITTVAGKHGAGIGGGHESPHTSGVPVTATVGTITIKGSAHIKEANGVYHGTGIGAGCRGTCSEIIIKGNAVIDKAQGGDDGAGIGASWDGACGNISIKDGATVTAIGGNNGAGIGAGSSGSKCGSESAPPDPSNPAPREPSIVIDTTGTVTATGGINGVGIGSGYGNSQVGDIAIKKGIIDAQGSVGSTGIGAGRGSTSGNITIGHDNQDPTDPTDKVVVTAQGGMTDNGGNILADSSKEHEKLFDPTTSPNYENNSALTIIGKNTTVRPGYEGEGLYSTSGAKDKDGNKIYSYPVNLFDTNETLPAAKDLPSPPPIPADAKNIVISDGTNTWAIDLSHKPLDNNYNFIWMTEGDKILTISYTDKNNGNQSVTLDLTWFQDAGVWRVKPNQSDPKPPPPPVYPPIPKPPGPDPDPKPTPGEPEEVGFGGIVLQIGYHTGEFLEVPTFYLSANSLKLNKVDISTQDNAINSIATLKNAINRVSDVRGSYGALYNRLEHNINNLGAMKLNMTDAESTIRDADIAKEMMKHTKNTILTQSAQAMLAQSNQNMSQVLQLLKG